MCWAHRGLTLRREVVTFCDPPGLTATRRSFRVLQCGKASQSLSGLSREVLAWVEAQLGGGVTAVRARSLHGGESPWWIDLELSQGRSFGVVFRTPSSRINTDMISTNATALQVAAEHRLPAPRLLAADLNGGVAGVPATLESVVRDATEWPARELAGLLRAAGAALARVHTVLLGPQRNLPFRPRPIAFDDFATERRLGRMHTTDLLRRADDQLRGLPIPPGPTVFVHGDVWPGNVLVAGGTIRALIDWKTAGVGHLGVDLGELRKQVAIAYGDGPPKHVLQGWERAAGTSARDVAFWDATAALNTPTDSDGPAVAAARDAFRRAALTEL